MNRPDFRMINPELRDYAWESWEEGSVDGILLLLNHGQRGEFLFRNIIPFLDRGFYEQALYETYIHGPHYKASQWMVLFRFADRKKLQTVGGSIPGEELTVYRGVSRPSLRSYIRGLSWTTEPGIAAWFATRYQQQGEAPAVYSLKIKPENIFFMTNERKENEAVVDVWQCGRMKRMKTMPDITRPSHG